MGSKHFSKYWRGIFGETPPLAHIMRVDFPEMWIRFHSLPKSKRYAQTDEERLIIRSRANSLARDCFKDTDSVWMIASFAWKDHIVANRNAIFSRFELEKEFVWRDRTEPAQDQVPFTFFIGKAEWKNGALDWIIDQIADDKLQAMFFEPSEKIVLAPYDGGFDLFVQDKAKLARLSDKFADWKSSRPDGL